MKQFYRVLRRMHARFPFNGEGAFLYGGRWSSVGSRLSYASEHQSLAMLEYFVHLDKDDPPDDLVLAIAEVPKKISQQRVAMSRLPRHWRTSPAPPELARIGDEFLRKGNYCMLIVPSALAPREENFLINPAHPEFRNIRLREVEPLSFDPRIVTARSRRNRPQHLG